MDDQCFLILICRVDIRRFFVLMRTAHRFGNVRQIDGRWTHRNQCGIQFEWEVAPNGWEKDLCYGFTDTKENLDHHFVRFASHGGGGGALCGVQ